MALTFADTRFRIVDQDHARVGEWMYRRGAGRWREGTTCIGLERHGELVAGTMYDWYNGASICAHIAIAGPITREWLWFIFHYPFVQLNCHVILAWPIAPDNPKSHNLCRHLGFTELTTIPDADPQGDSTLYIMHKSQCRYLNLKRRPVHAKA